MESHIPSTPRPSDADLLAAVAARDRVAFETLYHRYVRRLFGFVARWIDQPECQEEVVDDVLFTVWTDAAKFQGRSKVSTWIFGIAYRQAMVRLRRAPAVTSLDEVPEPSAEDPQMLRWELRASLQRALGRLSPEQRSVVELTYLEGYSYQEIAHILDCPVNTVKTRMFYARRLLREWVPTRWLVLSRDTTAGSGGSR